MQYENLIKKLIDLGIEEDINTGDVTTDSIIPATMNAVATMTAKQEGVISGLEIVKMVYDYFQKDVVFTAYFNDGDSVKKGDVILVLEAMKMQNNIEAENSGTVTSVLVSKGDTVMEGAPLITIG